jgi:hypothetical protein
MSAPAQPPARYRIRIHGHLDPAWSAWFDSLTVAQAADGTTELVGPLVDQAALFGLLARLRDLGATLLLVEHLDWRPPHRTGATVPSARPVRGPVGRTQGRMGGGRRDRQSRVEGC